MGKTDGNGHMIESGILDEADIEELFQASQRVRGLFAPMIDCSPSLQDVVHVELSLRDGFKTIYTSLYAMAIAELEVRSRTSSWFFLSSVSYEFEEIAHMAAEAPYSRRVSDEFLEITKLILDFFSGGDREEKDLFFFLAGVTRKNLSQVLKQISRSEKRLLHFVHTAVVKHVASSPRYTRRGKIVTDLRSPDLSTLRQATIFEITATCAPLLSGNEKPGEMVDLVFDELCRRKADFACHLHISTLRMAVFELIKARFISHASAKSGADPLQEYLQKETLALASEALSETVDSYGWREGGSASYRGEYGKAGWYILEEIIVSGDRPSHFDALKRHISGLDENTYRTKHKGSFQNFWKTLWESFLKKIRADI